MSFIMRKILALMLFWQIGISQPTQAVMAVVDKSNLAQNIISAAQSVTAVEKQIQQYQTQLQQYENMLQNTSTPASYIWDQATITIDKLLQAQETLSYYKSQAGSIGNYLSRYQDISYYRTSPCFTSNGCSNAQRQALLEARVQGSEAQKRANDAVLKGVDQQQQTLTSDAENLTQLQLQATNAKGQMQALQAANQLASGQVHQLLQIRGLLIAQQNAAATRAQIVTDREAQQAAASEQFRDVNYTKSPPKTWGIEDGVR